MNIKIKYNNCKLVLAINFYHLLFLFRFIKLILQKTDQSINKYSIYFHIKI